MEPQDEDRRAVVRGAAAQIGEQLAGRGRVLPDAVIDCPAGAVGDAPDLVVLAPGARPDGRGRYRVRDVEAVLDVAPPGRAPEHAARARAYAECGIATHVVVDPAAEVCTVHTAPAPGGAYREAEHVPFGNDLFLPLAGRTLVLRTDDFSAGRPTPGTGPDTGRGIVDG
ncbi:Uma2 family endonuclease [Kitasatospora sp. NBC_01560]|uniref:Uma2 family endonuclease n=1 Tax=Kitasatospora sp. NBC_01560 TaxID=2975965 RepID=UPI0038703B88